jgi:hypothetical protein
MRNLRTSRGQLDLTFRPAGTDGYEDLDRTASLHTIGRVQVRVAALAEVIRSKEAAGRRKDFQALPELYRLAGRTGSLEPPGNAAVAAQQSTEAARIAAARARARDRCERRHPDT